MIAITYCLLSQLTVGAPYDPIDWKNLTASPPDQVQVRRECDQLCLPGNYPKAGTFVKPFEAAMKALMANPRDDKALLRACLLQYYGGLDSELEKLPLRNTYSNIIARVWTERSKVRSYEMARAFLFHRNSVYGFDHFANRDVWIRITEFAEDPWTVSARCNSRAWSKNSKTDRAYRLSKREYLLKVPFFRFRFLQTVQITNLVEGLERRDKTLMRTAIGQIRQLETMIPPNHPEILPERYRVQADGLEELIKKW
jgi:hypothetical protein